MYDASVADLLCGPFEILSKILKVPIDSKYGLLNIEDKIHHTFTKKTAATKRCWEIWTSGFLRS